MSEKNTSLGEMMEGKTPRTSATDPSMVKMDKDTLHEFDPSTVMPKREEKDEFGDMIFGQLDAAIEREKEKISNTMDEILDKQREEIEEKAEAAEEARLESEDVKDGLNSVPTKKTASFGSDDEEDESAGLYDDDDDEEPEFLKPKTNKVTNKPKKEEPDKMPVRDIIDAIEETPAEEVVAEAASAESVEDVAADSQHTLTQLPEITPEDVANERVSILDAYDDDDLDDEDSENEEPDSDEIVETLKNELKGKVGIKKTLDLSKFTISKKPISVSKLMKVTTKADRTVADWVMYNARRPVSLTGLSGPEILALNPQNSARNRLNTFKEMYRVIYDHIEDANKPDYESWLKATRFVDLTHIYFGLYKATFNGSNFINYACPKCNKVFIKDIKFDDMVEYADDDTKEEIAALLKLDTTSPEEGGEYEAELVQISDRYVIAFRTPSIWRVIIETASLSDAFIEKYQNSIDVISYIDDIYVVDDTNNELIPVDTKPDPNDMSKTAARRIRAYNDIINGLSSEDYYSLRTKINTVDTDVNKLTYFVPGCKCPECGTDIPENKDMSTDQMLFTRHQLAAIASM